MGCPAGLMENMTVDEVRKAMKKTRTVLVPLGVVEQHGYHLPLSTDIYNAYQVCARVSEKTSCLVAPPLNYSFSGGELPGTINVAPNTMVMMVNDICHSLARQGFRNIVLVLGHGGTENHNALKDSTVLFIRQNPQWELLSVALAPVWEFSPVWKKALAEKDFHAGYVETSLMMYWAPDLVRDNIRLDSEKLVSHMRKHQDNYLLVRKKVRSPHVVPRISQRPDIKVGVMGEPHKASAEAGRKICGEVVKGISALVKKMESAR